jgi:DnaJ homolog subfamily A member 2
MPKDLYSLLEVPRGADPSEIRKSYLKLSRQYHPDKVAEAEKEAAEAKFKEISAAYDILSDEQKKGFYDQTGEIPGEGGGGGGPGPFGPGGMPFHFDMGGLFGMFGGGRGGPPPGMMRGRRPGKPPVRKTQIPLTLRDFYYGRILQVHIDRARFCGPCKGEGAMNVRPCQECQGSGVKRQIIQMGHMIIDNTGPCMACRGSGKTKGDTCGNCNGSKFTKQEKILELNIQPGMKHDEVVVFPGESSHVEQYEEAGDIHIELVAADEDHDWQRHGDNLHHRISLSLAESLCGKVVRLPGHPAYPNGLYVHIPSGVTNRQEIVVEGCGMPRTIGSGHGDAVLLLSVLATKDERLVLESRKDMLQAMFQLGPGEAVPPDAQLVYAKPLAYQG